MKQRRGGVTDFLVISLLVITMFLVPNTAVTDELQDLEKALAEEQTQSNELQNTSQNLERDLAEISRKLVAAAAQVQGHERTIFALEARIDILQVEELEKTLKLIDQRENFARILMSLERLARFPPEAMFAQPVSPSNTVRSAILLRSVVPEVERHAEFLRQQIVGLAQSRERLNKQRNSLQAVQTKLSEQGRTLSNLLEQKKMLKYQTDAEQKMAAQRAKDLSREADNLRELIASLQQDKYNSGAGANMEINVEEGDVATTTVIIPNDLALDDTPITSLIPLPPQKPLEILTKVPFSAQRGKLPFPVFGTIVGRYGENNENGVTQRGVKLATRSAAQVIAPYEGQIVFVGEFRGYGQLLIIEHSEGYHSLLSGMARIDSVMGQWVLLGEPVGIMDAAVDVNPILYVELRRNGQPINPLPWLTPRVANTQG